MSIRPLLALALSFSMGAPAFAQCLGEAQIIAKVVSFEKTSSSCRVFTDTSSIRLYNENVFCPLDQGQVVSTGVEVGFSDGHDCRLNVGDALTGILVLQASGAITLE